VNKRLLVVDDDADMRLTLKLALELAGYAVDVAGNGREAIELQKRQPADVLITDIFMPDADGFEAIDAFRRYFPQTKIVVVSGGAQFSKRDYLPDAELIGADATLQKPFDVDKLLGILRTL
jgi:CheY-like chemotaxis protein